MSGFTNIAAAATANPDADSNSAAGAGFGTDGKVEIPTSADDSPSVPATDEKKPVDEEEDAPEEVLADVYIDTLLEEIINDWSNGGPFVHRLMAYRTPLGEIVIRNEKIKIEDGTKLNMGKFENCEFSFDCGEYLAGNSFSYKIELSRRRAFMRQGQDSFNQLGSNQKLVVGSKSVADFYNGNEVSYKFRVYGRSLMVSADGSVLSDSQDTTSSSSSGHTVINARGGRTNTNDGPGTMFISGGRVWNA